MPIEPRPAPVPRPEPAGTGNNAVSARSHNRRLVLNLIRAQGLSSRPVLARQTGLSAAAIGNILDSLAEDGLIAPAGRLRGRRGQPALQYEIDPAGAWSLGVEVGRRGLATAVVDLGGTVTARRLHPVDTRDAPACLALIADQAAELGARHPGIRVGIGIVRPEPFGLETPDSDDSTSLPQWAGMAADDLSDALGAPIVLDNDANAAAVAEHLFGAAKGLDDFAVMYFGDGIGLGLFSHGLPLTGAHRRAGEIGHVVVVPDGHPCPCGQRGCLERYVSRHALADALGMRLAPGAVTALWQRGDPRLRAWIDEAARHLATVARMLATLLDPAAIILGGQLPAPVLTALTDAVAPRLGAPAPVLARGICGDFAAATGAAVLPFHRALSGRSRTSEEAFP